MVGSTTCSDTTVLRYFVVVIPKADYFFMKWQSSKVLKNNLMNESTIN